MEHVHHLQLLPNCGKENKESLTAVLFTMYTVAAKQSPQTWHFLLAFPIFTALKCLHCNSIKMLGHPHFLISQSRASCFSAILYRRASPHPHYENLQSITVCMLYRLSSPSYKSNYTFWQLNINADNLIFGIISWWWGEEGKNHTKNWYPSSDTTGNPFHIFSSPLIFRF